MNRTHTRTDRSSLRTPDRSAVSPRQGQRTNACKNVQGKSRIGLEARQVFMVKTLRRSKSVTVSGWGSRGLRHVRVFPGYGQHFGHRLWLRFAVDRLAQEGAGVLTHGI